jgi:hypothetical protein
VGDCAGMAADICSHNCCYNGSILNFLSWWY